MHAVMKQAKQPETRARKDTPTMSSFRLGAMAVSAPIMIPSAVRLANPQRAYVATTTECSLKKSVRSHFKTKSNDPMRFLVRYKEATIRGGPLNETVKPSSSVTERVAR